MHLHVVVGDALAQKLHGGLVLGRQRLQILLIEDAAPSLLVQLKVHHDPLLVALLLELLQIPHAEMHPRTATTRPHPHSRCRESLQRTPSSALTLVVALGRIFVLFSWLRTTRTRHLETILLQRNGKMRKIEHKIFVARDSAQCGCKSLSFTRMYIARNRHLCKEVSPAALVRAKNVVKVASQSDRVMLWPR